MGIFWNIFQLESQNAYECLGICRSIPEYLGIAGYIWESWDFSTEEF